MGRPICSVSSVPSASWRSFSSFKAFLTICCLSDRAVRRYDSKARAAVSGTVWRSASERPLRVRTGLLVMGEMVVIVSSDMTMARRGNVTSSID